MFVRLHLMLRMIRDNSDLFTKRNLLVSKQMIDPCHVVGLLADSHSRVTRRCMRACRRSTRKALARWMLGSRSRFSPSE
jgi:transposase